MFAGIVKGTGRIADSLERHGDRRIVIDTAGIDLGEIRAGDSVSVNGVCLTATDPVADAFTADVSAATLRCTTLGNLRPGDPVNLEPSLRLGEAIAGHLVYGHVDAVGRVEELRTEARSVAMTIEIAEAMSRYIAVKGSVTVDGVSLTVNAVERGRFTVNIIPHTREVTVISGYARGTPVNIEVDMIARYLERLISADDEGLSLDKLKRHGYIESD